jgi:ribosome biogenesis GTPase
VLVDLGGDPLRLTEVLPRRNYLGRTASSHDPREQILAANVDQLLAISSIVKPGFSSNRTDRILAACVWHDIPAVLVLNKIDLVDEDDVAAVERTYLDIPVPVLRTCAVDGRGVDELRALLSDGVSVLYGASGAGKSTLLNAVQPGLNLKTGKISKYWHAGKHTTTHSQLFPLEAGGWVVDTPGIRVFRLYEVGAAELRGLFP